MSNNSLLRRRMLMQAGGSPTPPEPVHPFSISASQKVVFAPANLQYHCLNGIWRFAENQWDCIGLDNSNISPTYNGWIDMFGYGTSGWNSGATAYLPTSVSTNNADYINANLTGANANADWGVYNSIYNPTTNTTDPAGTWRTLTGLQWMYLQNSRSTTSGIRYARATVHEMNNCAILLPDDWDATLYTFASTNTWGTATNISDADWTFLESCGCILLPFNGTRTGNSTAWPNTITSDYACSTQSNSTYAHTLESANGVFGIQNRNKYFGMTVRLVKDVN